MERANGREKLCVCVDEPVDETVVEVGGGVKGGDVCVGVGAGEPVAKK